MWASSAVALLAAASTIFIGAAWSEFDVRSQQEWQCRIDHFMQAAKTPLVITVNH